MPGVVYGGGLPDAHRLKALLDLIGIESIADLSLSRAQSLDWALRHTYRYCHELFRPEEHAALEFYRGLLHLLWGDCNGAFYYFETACDQARRLNHKRLIALCCLSTGCMRLNLANVPEAMSQYRYVRQCIDSGRRNLTQPAWHPAHDARHLFWNTLEEVWHECWRQARRRLYDEDEPPRPEPDDRPPRAEAAANGATANGSSRDRPAQEPAPSANGHGRPAAATAEPRVARDMHPRPPAPPPPVSEHITQVLTPLPPRLATMPEPQEAQHRAQPAAFALRPDYEFFHAQEVASENAFIPGLTPEDWLVAHTQARRSDWSDLVIVGMERPVPALCVRRPGTQRNGREKLYLMRHELRAGRTCFYGRPNMRANITRPDQWVGNVVGFYRPLHLPARRTLELGVPIILGQPEPIQPMEAPTRRILRLADHLQLYCVTEKDGYYIFPEVQAGDWLIVSTRESRLHDLKPNDALVLGGPGLQGGVRLRPGTVSATTDAPFLAQFVRDAEYGAIEFVADLHGMRTLLRHSIMGVVLGFFRYVKTT